jgi:hypothetical protein
MVSERQKGGFCSGIRVQRSGIAQKKFTANNLFAASNLMTVMPWPFPGRDESGHRSRDGFPLRIQRRADAERTVDSRFPARSSATAAMTGSHEARPIGSPGAGSSEVLWEPGGLFEGNAVPETPETEVRHKSPLPG